GSMGRGADLAVGGRARTAETAGPGDYAQSRRGRGAARQRLSLLSGWTIRAELCGGSLGERHVDHLFETDVAGQPALALKECKILADAVGPKHAVRIKGRRIHLCYEIRIEPEIAGDDVGDLLGFYADQSSIRECIIVGANAAQIGLHEFVGRIRPAGRKTVAVEYGGHLIVGI